MHPMQRDCDPNEPKRFAAWAWAAGIPDPSPARPMPIPLIAPQVTEVLSEQLWNFGFRHHEDLQTQWIEGGAGLGMLAQIVKEKPERDPVEELAEVFLGENNPKLLEAIQKAPPEERARLLANMERSLEGMHKLIDQFKDL